MKSIIIIVSFAFIIVNCSSPDLFSGCFQTPCSERSLRECSLRNEPWAAVIVDKKRVCVCCSHQKDAFVAAGLEDKQSKGLFYGDNEKICETIPIDENVCRRRHNRDCNYQVVINRDEFIGCFYCRPPCTSQSECQELGCDCGISSKYQPVRSCTFNAIVNSNDNINLGSVYDDIIRSDHNFMATGVIRNNIAAPNTVLRQPLIKDKEILKKKEKEKLKPETTTRPSYVSEANRHSNQPNRVTIPIRVNAVINSNSNRNRTRPLVRVPVTTLRPATITTTTERVTTHRTTRPTTTTERPTTERTTTERTTTERTTTEEPTEPTTTELTIIEPVNNDIDRFDFVRPAYDEVEIRANYSWNGDDRYHYVNRV